MFPAPLIDTSICIAELSLTMTESIEFTTRVDAVIFVLFGYLLTFWICDCYRNRLLYIRM
jgi:hypothetical protein